MTSCPDLPHVYLALICEPDDRTPCPPDNEAILNSLANYIREKQRYFDFPAGGMALRPNGEAVVIVARADIPLVDEYLDDDLPDKDGYYLLVSLAMFAEYGDGSNAQSAAKLLMSAWASGHIDGIWPKATCCQWRTQDGECGDIQ